MKTLVIARFFGASAELDAYLLAFLLPAFIAEVLCGAIVPALVPHLIELSHQGNERVAKELYTGAVWRSVTLVCCVAVVIAVFAGLLMFAHIGGPRVILSCSLLFVMLPILPLSATANVWRATLNAQERFVVAAGASALTPLTITLSLFIAGPRVYWLAVGTTAGALGEMVVLGLAVRGMGLPLLGGGTSQWRSEGDVALRGYGSLALTNLVMCGSLFLDQSMAALLGSGAVSILNYGTRLVAVLIAIGPDAFGIALLPRLSRIIVESGATQAHQPLKQFLAIAMGGSAIVTAVLVHLSGPIVKIAFQHGAFSSKDALEAAWVQRMSLLQLPFAVGAALLSRFISSIKLNRILIPISITSLLLNAGLNFVLMRWYSVAGIALATTFAQAATFGMLFMAVSRILRSQDRVPW